MTSDEVKRCEAHLLEELHADVGVVLVSTPHLLHVLDGFRSLPFQHADLDARTRTHEDPNRNLVTYKNDPDRDRLAVTCN